MKATGRPGARVRGGSPGECRSGTTRAAIGHLSGTYKAKASSGYTDSRSAADEIMKPAASILPMALEASMGMGDGSSTRRTPPLRPPEKSMIRALRSNQFWLTAAYLGSLLLMARGYA